MKSTTDVFAKKNFSKCTTIISYYEYQVRLGATKIWGPGFNAQLLLLSRATYQPLTSVVAKRAKIAGDNIVTTGNTKILSPNSVAPYSTDNHSSSYVNLTWCLE